jgi:hypothetical protein
LTYTVYEVNGSRRWDLQIQTPKGCKNARPCIDGVDFLVWSPSAV